MRLRALVILTLLVIPGFGGSGVQTDPGDPAGAQRPGRSPGFDLRDAVHLAAAGQELRVPAGRYEGPIVIERPIRIVAAGEVVIDGGGSGDVITIRAPDVVLQGLSIRNTGTSLDRENAGITVTAPRVTIEACTLEDVLFGIYLKEAPDSVIRGNTISSKDLDLPRRGDGIRLWQSPRSIVEDNTVRRSRDLVMWFSEGVQLRRNTVRDGRYGMHFMYSDDDVLEDNRLEDNSVGAFLMYSRRITIRRNTFARNRGPSGYGLGLKEIDGATVENNQFVNNRIGIHLDNAPSSVDITHTFRNNVIAYNDIGVAFMPSVTRNVFTANTFLENVEQVAVLGDGKLAGNLFTVAGRGNYWSDYTGFDLDGDGIGDVDYQSSGLFENLVDREPKLRVFLYSPSQRAVEAAARAFPIVAPRPKLTDSAPLMEPVDSGVRPGPPAAPGRTWAVAGGLLAIGLCCIAAGARPFAGRRGIGGGAG